MLLDLLPLLSESETPPAPPAVIVGGAVYRPDLPRRVPRRNRGRLQVRVVAHATARTRGHGKLAFRFAAHVTPRPARSAALARLALAATLTLRPMQHPRAAVRASSATVVRCHDHTHLRPPLHVLDLIFDSWET